MELDAVFNVINEALKDKDVRIFCQQEEIKILKKKIEELESKLEPKDEVKANGMLRNWG
jgi:peptidoglycan hydrolase CwlO-like protein